MIDPHIVAGLATLIVLELVLGIDNLVFVAILAGKLPAHQRDRARLVGLGMAMAMRLGLLAVMSKLVALTETVFTLFGRGFSWRDMVLVGGGVFLLYKATGEIHERLEGATETADEDRRTPSFWVTIAQIVILDAIFSLDSIITAVGMVEHLWVMMTAVVLSMGIMIAASKPLTTFVSRHPTVIILCLSFLLLIGCSLLAEGVGFHFPKEYLYAAIGFSLLIEGLNQLGGHRRRKAMMHLPSRQRAADAIQRLLSPAPGALVEVGHQDVVPGSLEPMGELPPEESSMIRGVISLSTLPVRSIMTLRPEIVWIRADADMETIRSALLENGRTRVLLCSKDIDHVIGVIDVRAALKALVTQPGLDVRTLATPPMYVFKSMTTSRLMEEMRRRDERFAIVTDAQGDVEGVVTTTDIFAVIAGDLADDEDDDLILSAGGSAMQVRGLARVVDVETHFGQTIGAADRDYETVAGHLLAIATRIPEQGDVFDRDGLRFTILEVDGRKIELVEIRRMEKKEV